MTVPQCEARERTTILLPASLKRQVEAVARANKRSTTREIESALERHVAAPKEDQ